MAAAPLPPRLHGPGWRTCGARGDAGQYPIRTLGEFVSVRRGALGGSTAACRKMRW
jgi:hypothetical protein